MQADNKFQPVTLPYQIHKIYPPIFENQGSVLRRIVSSDSFSFVPTWLVSSKAIFTTTMLIELPILLSRYTWDTFKKRGMRKNNIFFPETDVTSLAVGA